MESGAKAMLVKSKKSSKISLLVISAAKGIDWKKVKKLLGPVELVPYEKVPEVTGCLSGMTPLQLNICRRRSALRQAPRHRLRDLYG